MKNTYTFNELKEEMNILENTFDIVRIVSPYNCKLCNMKKINDKVVFEDTENCYSTWNITKRCNNCISAKAVNEKNIFTKLEYIDDSIFLIIAKYICVDGICKSLEMVKDVTNSLNFNSIVEEKFKKTISAFNCEINLDTLTQVYNRHYMEYNFRDILHKAKIKKISVHMAIIDIDYFKSINDTYGHLAGDEVLTALASNIKRIVKKSSDDYVVRFGGDEFIVLSVNREFDDFKECLQKLVSYTATTPIKYQDSDITVTLSIGTVNGSVSKIYDLNELISLTDARLYIAKDNGRNRIV